MAKTKISEANLLYAVWSQYQRVHTESPLNPGYIWSKDTGRGYQWYMAPAGFDQLVLTRRDGGVADNDLFCFTRNGNILFGGYGEPGGVRTFAMLNGTAPTFSVGGVHLWSESGELKVRDNSANVTTLSPHHLDQVDIDAEDTLPVAIHHQNPYIGQEETIYLSKLARLVEAITGEQVIYKRTMTRQERRNYQADEMDAALAQNARIDAYDAHRAEIEALPEPQRSRLLQTLPPRPQARESRPLPDWVQTRIPAE